jgi:hypothetical protein
MVINILSAGGAGKSTLVRNIMARYPSQTPFYIDGRKRPIGYGCERPDTPPLWVIGQYEAPTRGGDTFKTLDEVFEQVRAKAALGLNVIFESLIIQCETRRLISLHREFPLLVVELTTPLPECLAGIHARRLARGDKCVLDPTYTIRK